MLLRFNALVRLAVTFFFSTCEMRLAPWVVTAQKLMRKATIRLPCLNGEFFSSCCKQLETSPKLNHKLQI